MESENGSPSQLFRQPSAIGLSVLVSPDNPSIDIVFIHGFTGHPIRAWTHKGDVCEKQPARGEESGERPSKIRKVIPFASSIVKESGTRKTVYWPQDLVPITAPTARVLVYGYDTHVRHRLGPGTSKNTLYDIAWDFLISLEAERHENPARSLLFVAHSLGGIVVKEALRRSRGCDSQQSHLHNVYESTTGILFFGTPHSGADQRLVQSIAEKAAKAVGFMINDQILDSLLPASERLKELRNEFGPMARQQQWIIYSFQEEYGVTALNGKKVVEDTASCLNDPSIEISQHISGNHTEMCRFSGLDDVEYKKVARALTRVLESSEKALPLNEAIILDAAQRMVYLNSLRFGQIDSRRTTIKTAHAKTCKWLLSKHEYLDWLNTDKISEHHGFLWIKGKPATGKSTIMKFAHANASKAMEGTIIISFFFNARGEQLEKSVLGMFRSLLVQLFEKLPQLQCVFDSLDPKPSYGQWDLEMVKTLFKEAIKKLEQRSLTCFIDALDECEEDEVRDMVQFFEDLGESTTSCGIQFRVCFSSRHYPHIAIQKSVQLVLEGQEGHLQDIANYVNSELRAGKSKRVEEIKDEILERAAGIFLWVVLVIKMLNKEFDRGRLHALRQRLDEIPNGLEELFLDILTRDCQNMEELVLCLQWILYAKRPLKCEELYYAILSGVEPGALTKWDPTEITKEDMERFILSSSKGLADLTKSRNQTVQFIHESVRDFLFRGNALDTIKSNLSNNFPGKGHDKLRECCQNYLKIDISEHFCDEEILTPVSIDDAARICRTLSENFPFLEYSLQNVFRHADSAHTYGLLQKSVTEQAFLQNWILLHNIFERYPIRRYHLNTSLLYILADLNLSSLIKPELERDSYREYHFGRYQSPLHAALARKNEDTVRVLLFRDIPLSKGNSYQEEISYMIENRKELISQKSGNILYWAAEHQHEAIAKMLLESTLIDQFALDSKESQGRTPLSWAAGWGYHTVVKLLLKRSQVNVNSKCILKRTPLSWAACYGNEAVVELLLGVDEVNINSKDSSNQTPLSLAARRGHAAVIELLLRTDSVDINAKDIRNQTPLSLAAEHGHVAIFEMLLRTDRVDINSKDYNDRTPLSFASKHGHLAIVELLLKADGVDVNSKDHRNRTPLSLAAQHGHVAVVELLLRTDGADLNSKTADNHTALSLATSFQHMDVVQLLLETTGIDVNSTFYDQNPLSLAVKHGCVEVVKLLLQNTAVNHLVNEDIRTSLSLAAENRHAAILELFLKEPRIEAEIKGDNIRKLFTSAIEHGDVEVVKLNTQD